MMIRFRSAPLHLALALATIALVVGGCGEKFCGDGEISDNEECDDGNNADGDGCSALCQLETGGEVCDNGSDDDGDGDVDCDDADCAGDPACAGPVEDCSNGTDDDGDGDIDCADSDCATDPACVAGPETDCTNGVDDDGDGDIDCADFDCGGDPACTGGEDCSNGLDDDGDGDVDCADADCAAAPACVMGPETDCTNGVDDDGDGAADCADSDCAGDPACAMMGVCGDGTVDPGEECDDGNTTAGDGCDASCMNEAPSCIAATPVDVTASIDGPNATGMVGMGASFYNGSCDPAGGPGPEEVLTITVTSVMSLRVSTDNPGTDFDTVLYVRQGDCNDPMQEIGCDNAGGNFANVTLYDLQPGVYYIFVDGNNGDSGNYEVSIVTATCGDGIVDGPLGEFCDDGNTMAGDGCDASCLPEPVTCSMGGPFTDITGNIDGASVMGTTPGGAGDYSNPTCDTFGTDSGEDIYQIVLTAPSTDLRISNDTANTNFDSVIHVRYMDCDDPSLEVACENDVGSMTGVTTYLTNAPPGTYWIFVDGNNGDNGDYELVLSTMFGCGDGIPDPGELCDDGNTMDGDGCSALCQVEFGMCVTADSTANLSPGPDMLTIDTTMNTDDVDVPCLGGGGSGGGADHWISFDVTAGPLDLTVNFDQGAGPDHLFAIAADSGGTCSWVACDDPFGMNMGMLSYPGLATGTYYLVVDAYNGGGEGTVDLILDLN